MWPAVQQSHQGQPEKSLWRESIPWTRLQWSPGEVEAKSMVDMALQRPMCAGGPGHQWLHTCIQGQGWECSCWLIHTWITVQSGGKQGRAHTSSNGEDSYLMWEICLSREMKKWTWRTFDQLLGWHGGLTARWKRWDERLWGARRFHHFCEIFTGPFCLFGCFVLFVLVFCLRFFCFLAGEKTPASNSSFTFFAFAHPESWPTMPRARSAM